MIRLTSGPGVTLPVGGLVPVVAALVAVAESRSSNAASFASLLRRVICPPVLPAASGLKRTENVVDCPAVSDVRPRLLTSEKPAGQPLVESGVSESVPVP